jgi:HAD superfamily hydrolase (TIGR01509 family)
MTCRGLFLDLDGTLADSLPMLRNVYHAFLGRFGVQGSEEEFQSLNGPPLWQIVQRIRETYNLSESPERLLDRYLALLSEAHELMMPAAGAEDVLAFARGQGWKISVVTSSPSGATVAWLRRFGLYEFMDTVVGGDDVTKGKPDPEPYLLALQRTGCLTVESFAVEDSAHGARSAGAAGLPLWFLGTTIPSDVAASSLFRGSLPRFGNLLEVLERARSHS